MSDEFLFRYVKEKKRRQSYQSTQPTNSQKSKVKLTTFWRNKFSSSGRSVISGLFVGKSRNDSSEASLLRRKLQNSKHDLSRDDLSIGKSSAGKSNKKLKRGSMIAFETIENLLKFNNRVGKKKDFSTGINLNPDVSQKTLLSYLSDPEDSDPEAINSEEEEIKPSKTQTKKKSSEQLAMMQRPAFKLYSGGESSFHDFAGFASISTEFRFIKDFIMFFAGEYSYLLELDDMFIKSGIKRNVDRIENCIRIYYQSGKFILQKEDGERNIKANRNDYAKDLHSIIYNYGSHTVYDMCDAFKRLLRRSAVPLLRPEIEDKFLSAYKNFRTKSLSSKRTLKRQLQEFEAEILETIAAMKQPFSSTFCQLILLLRYAVMKHPPKSGYAFELALTFAPVLFPGKCASLAMNGFQKNVLNFIVQIIYFLLDSNLRLPTSKISYRDLNGVSQDLIKHEEISHFYRSRIKSGLRFNSPGSIPSEGSIEKNYVYQIKLGLYQGRKTPISRTLVDCLNFLRPFIREHQDFFFKSVRRMEALTDMDICTIEKETRYRFFECGPAGLLKHLKVLKQDVTERFRVGQILLCYLHCHSPKLVDLTMYHKQLKYIYKHYINEEIPEKEAVLAMNTFVLDVNGPRNRAALCLVLDFMLRMINFSTEPKPLKERLCKAFAPVLIDVPRHFTEKENKKEEAEAEKMLMFLIELYNRLKIMFWKNRERRYDKLIDQDETYLAPQTDVLLR